MRLLRSVIRWVKSLFTKVNMRRKISLYIADQLVDLDDQSFILFNYTMDDLSNPTVVKNSFSQQITLKGTPANNRVFGDSFRLDRRVAYGGSEAGVDFNASQKTPFTIYDEMGEILESGYAKLDSIDRRGADIQYKVTLYGGLGSFFYALSYDENGNRRTLADLDYLHTSNPDAELDFAINADSVLDAWQRLSGNMDNDLAYFNNIDNQALYSDGTLHNATDFHVREYSVGGYHKLLVTGRSGVSPACLAVALNSSGDALEAWGVGGSRVYTNYGITLPPNAVVLRVMGYGTGAINVKTATPSPMWDIINFAPAYNGIPEGNFSPDKGLVNPAEVGLQDSITQGEGGEAVTYTTMGGYALVNLAEAHDEWAVKDIRSYLQRPVFSMRAFWDAICDQANNGGYEVDASVLRDYVAFGQYTDLWMTLPLLSSRGTIKQETGNLSLTMSSTATTGHAIGRFDLSGSVPSGTKVTASLHCRVRFNTPSGADTYSSLYRSVTQRDGRTTLGKMSVLFIQAVAYASDDSVVGGSGIKVTGSSRNIASLAAACGYTPAWAADYEPLNVTSFSKVSAGVFEIPMELGFNVEAKDVSYYKIMVTVYQGVSRSVSSGSGSQSETVYTGGGTSLPEMYVDYENKFTPDSAFIVQGATSDSVTYASSENLRSGARVTKAMLLSTSHTPAEYMLSFCKMFGLYFTYDVASRKVTILRRNELYQDETIDLTRRVDISKGVNIQPMVFNAKWYDFILDGVGGAFYDEYLNVEGIPYGIQRVNTGYDFNADSVNLMDSVVFKNACTILARSKYFNIIYRPVNIDSEIPIDTSTYPTTNRYIDGNGAWKNNTSFYSIMIPVTPGQRFVFHVGSAVGTVAVLASGDQTLNATADFCQDYPQRIIPTDGQIITIPSDGQYLFMMTKASNGWVDTVVARLVGITSVFQPSPFLDKGNTYTLWSADGDTIETDISCPPSTSSISYYNENPSLHGYDVDSARKLELRTADNKPIDGSDILVFHEGWNHYPYFKVTDDVPAMNLVNDGVPCWLLGAGDPQNSVYMPIFQRYVYGNIHLIESSLDFGVPRQLDIPGVRYNEGCVIYDRGWKRYLADRYDVNTKVMRCRVNFQGIQVNRDLLRKFYWYENSLWALNKIINYSLTTFDPVECEFIQVQDKENYLNGQNFYY